MILPRTRDFASLHDLAFATADLPMKPGLLCSGRRDFSKLVITSDPSLAFRAPCTQGQEAWRRFAFAYYS